MCAGSQFDTQCGVRSVVYAVWCAQCGVREQCGARGCWRALAVWCAHALWRNRKITEEEKEEEGRRRRRMGARGRGDYSTTIWKEGRGEGNGRVGEG